MLGISTARIVIMPYLISMFMGPGAIYTSVILTNVVLIRSATSLKGKHDYLMVEWFLSLVSL
jgi:hypothetical protein